MLPEKWGILFLSANAFTGKERSHDTPAHAARLLENDFQTDQPADFFLFLELAWLRNSADPLSHCHLSCDTDWFYLFKLAALSGNGLVYRAAALCSRRIFSAAATAVSLCLSLCRCCQPDRRASTGTVCLLSALALPAWAAVAVGVAVAVLPLGDSLVFAAGSRCTGWNLVDDGSFAICHVVCFLCSRIFLAFASADRCTGVTGARIKCTLQDDFTPCIFTDGWEKKTVVQIVAAKSAALVAAALLEQDCDDADGLYRRDLQGITICQ